MIWLIRHTERLLKDDSKWLKSKRGKENNTDMPITKKGEKYVEKAVNEMIKNDTDFEKIDFIYCSPMTRCIQTSIVIQDTIRKLTKKWIPIKIEYGLKELHVIDPIKHRKYKNGKIVIEPDYKNEIVLDKKLHVKETIKKYGKFPDGRIDQKYKSFMSFKETKYKEINHIVGGNKSLKTMKHILKSNKNKNYIVCSHAAAMCNLYTAFTKKIITEYIAENIIAHNWASLLGFKFKNNKYILSYGPTIEYWKKK